MPDKEEKKSEKKEGQAQQNERVMPFLDHLEELRHRLLKSILSIVLLSLGSYFFSKQIMQILLRPYPHDKTLIFLKPTEGFLVYIAGILYDMVLSFSKPFHAKIQKR